MRVSDWFEHALIVIGLALCAFGLIYLWRD
jgi:hypothetical protein